MEGCCVVQVEKFSATPAATVPIPFVLRTDDNIREQRRGCFSLCSGQTKTIPVLFRNPRRKHEWFMFDEQGKAHYVPAQDGRITIGVCGVSRNVSIEVEITGLERLVGTIYRPSFSVHRLD